MTRISKAYIGLGSNLGDRERTIRRSLELLSQEPAVDVVGVSSLRETDPVDYVEQPRFLNGACAIETGFRPTELLERMQSIENTLGRTRGDQQFGPRIIDLDLLLYGNKVIDSPALTLPHPRLVVRRFVLEPLFELNPQLTLPDGTLIRELLTGEG